MSDPTSMIAILACATLLPFVIAAGTCFAKISIVFVIVRNALGLQQVPSNMVLNGVALMLSVFVMLPVGQKAYAYYTESRVRMDNVEAVRDFVDNGLVGYRDYLKRFSDPELLGFFNQLQRQRDEAAGEPAARADAADGPDSLFSLMPAYALSEIKGAFTIGFYVFLPFVVIDLLVSSVLLALGMMMMSPVTISTPLKLLLFVALDGWSLLSEGLVRQYLALMAA